MRLLYVFLSTLAFLCLAPFLLVFRKTRDGWAERLGFYKEGSLPSGGRPRVWLHGASAGDLLALSPIIDRLRAQHPQAAIVVSTMTNTGYLMAKERLRERVDAVVFAPWDLWGATRRAARAIRPDVLVLEYTEIWPNLIRAAKRVGARIVLTNGRFSPTHLARYRLFFGAIGNPLSDIDLFLMREADEAERALSLGAAPERVQVAGNTKFDALVPLAQAGTDEALRAALAFPPGAPVWIAGSTHEGEEETLVAVYRKLREQVPALRLVIAPRYIDRAERVVSVCSQAGFVVARRSQGNAQGAPVVVLDTIGELGRAYGLADVVFVGGSFTTRGGQNILEPAAQGKAVLFGPHMENFHDSVQVLVGRGGIQVKDGEHLGRVLAELFGKPGALESLGSMAHTAVRQVSGASDRIAAAISRLLPVGP